MVRLNQNRSKLLLGCGSAALAMGLAAFPHAASAQAIQATDTTVSGSITRTPTGTGTETITVNTSTAVVNWTPDEDGNGNALDFLPTGNTVTFQNDLALADFAILNRILPAANGNVVVFDGTVISRLLDPLGQSTPGGTVAFYSPTGIFVGGNAVFDVGNLILTTLDPDLASFDDFAINGGQLQMFGQTGTTAQIIFAPGSQVIASAENSFFAVTAAEIQFFGTSNVNGSTAFVGGEQVNVTVSNGLFDIQIPVGSSSGIPITLDGDIGGPSSTGTGDNHLIYAVAAAQTDPISLLFSGNLGFQPATQAGIVNGEIILTTNNDVFGRTVAGGSVDGPFDQIFAFNDGSRPDGSIFLQDFASTSTILALAQDQVQANSFAGTSSVDGNLTLVSRTGASLFTDAGQSFAITGNLTVDAIGFGFEIDNGTGVPTSGQGGTAQITVLTGSDLSVGGLAIVRADSFVGGNEVNGVVGDGQAGNALVNVLGGTFVTDGLGLSARGFAFNNPTTVQGGTVTGGSAVTNVSDGGSLFVTNDYLALAGAQTFDPNDPLQTFFAGDAFGGFAQLAARTGGLIDIGGDVNLNSDAVAATTNATAAGGALADAGDVSLFIDGPEIISIGGNLGLSANGFGGSSTDGLGGDGLGGAARGFIPNGGTLTIGGDVLTRANGTGGTGIGGGNGLAGIAGIQVLTGLVEINGNFTSEALGFGANSIDGLGGDGGDGTGGNAFLQVDGTLQAPGTITVAGDAFLDATGRGGRGGNGDGDAFVAGNGGVGTGGRITDPNQADPNFGSGAFLLAGGDNGNLSVGGVSNVFNFGIGGQGGDGGLGQNGGNGGDGFGGTAQAGSSLLGLDGSVAAGTVNLGDVTLFANGDGGSGGAGSGTGSIQGNGGNGEGFGAFFTSRAGTTVAGNVNINADGTGGFGHVGGQGTGGSAGVLAQFGTDLTATSISAFAVGRGGFGDNAGGAAIGGNAFFFGDAFTANIIANMQYDAGADGGATAIGMGGSADGGFAELDIDGDGNSLTTGGSVILRATATSGQSVDAANGAVARGGSAVVTLDGQSSIDIGSELLVQAIAVSGGNTGAAPGLGANAFGGRTQVRVDLGGSVAVTDDLNLQSFAFGGSGGDGGAGFGGIADAQVIVGQIDVGGAANANASGVGGQALGIGGLGGNGHGGAALIIARGTQTESGIINIGGDAGAVANGLGGTGGNGDSVTSGGAGGGGFGGSEAEASQIDTGVFNGARIYAGGDNGAISVGGSAIVIANANGGQGGQGLSGPAGGMGGDAVAGTSSFGLVLFGTDGTVGAGQFNVANSAFVGTEAFGGIGGSGAIDGDGGLAVGGRSLILSRAGSLVVTGDAFTSANATGGTGDTGGDALGGDRSGTATSFGGSMTFGSFVGTAVGQGGFSVSGIGGTGTGGTAFMGFQDGTTLVNGDATVDASGIGGASQLADGGIGMGGIADLAIFTATTGQGTINGHASVLANGTGGNGGNGARGGDGFGGEAYVQTQAGGSITLGSGQIVASGLGGSGAGATGGDGFGGFADLIAIDNGSTLTIINETLTSLGQLSQSISLLAANGIGGQTSGGTGIGGTGTGGEAIVTVANGAVMTLAQSTQFQNRITARGVGGTSTVDGGTGGSAFGGLGIIQVDGGTLDAGRALLSVFAPGGSSFNDNINVNGGDGDGGDRQVNVINGGELTIELVGGVAGGSGGRGSGTGNGGNGTGGTASLFVENSTVNFEGRSIIGNQVSGGEGFNGGDAVANSATAFITGSTINLVNGATLLVGSNAFAGSGEGGATASGGDATAGTTVVNVSNSTISGGTLQVAADASGGTGFNSLPGQGGNAFGGVVDVTIGDSILSIRTAEDTIGFVFDPLTGQQVQQTFPGQVSSISATANGGDGLVGGNATSGIVNVNILNTDVTISPSTTQDGILQVSVDATGGDGVTQGGEGRASDLSLLFSGSTVTGGTLQVLGSGRGGSAENVGGLGHGAEVFVVGTEADISLQGEFLIAAEGFGGGGETGGDALGGVASLDLLATSLAMTQDGGGIARILIESSGNAGDGTVQMGNATAGLSQLLMLDSSISSLDLFLASEAEAASASTGVLGGNAAGGEIEAIIEGGSLMDVSNFGLAAPGVSGPGGTASGGYIGLSVGGPQGAPDLLVDQVDLDANANGGDTNTAGQFVVSLRSGQLAVNSLFAGAQGDFGTPALGVSSISAIGGSLPVTGSLGVSVTDDFDIEFGQGSIIGGPSIAAPTASVSIISQGTISIIGDDDNFIGMGGLNMNLVSRDIDIEAGARIGAGNLVLRSLNEDNPAIIGGNSGSNSPGPGEGYVLSQEEAGRLEVGEFLFIQPLVAGAGPNDPDIIIRDITAFGSLDDGAQSITVTTDGDQPGGIIRVEGVVVFQDASSTDQFGLFAPGGRIEIVTPGGIGVVGSTGNPSGNLFLGADQIWIADSDMIALLQSDPFFSGRNDQLAVAASGSEDPLGYLRGGSVSLEVGSQLLVRNTGTSSEQGGILVGDGGLSIRSNIEGSLDVFAYGARLDSSGNLITGQAFYQEVNFNNDSGSSFITSYTDDSEFNDCLINTGECASTVDPEPEPPTNEESADPAVVAINNPAVVEAAISAVQPVETSEQESDTEFGVDFPGLVEAEDVDELVDIDDPVASGGDSSLYIFGGIVQVEDDEDEDEDKEDEGSDD